MSVLQVISGSLVGLSLGLTGGGGAIFAVPLLVYGLQMAPRSAVAVSLASVGMTSLVGFLARWRHGQAEVRTGWLFAGAGMLGTPAGTWIANQLPDTVLLVAFACLMVLIAIRMWQQAGIVRVETQPCESPAEGPTCRRTAEGTLVLNSRCARLLVLLGIGAGVLSGLFGVGGGFVIVPALVLFSGMSIQRAVGTSLMVITLVSLAGLVTHWLGGREIPWDITLTFVSGSIAGLLVGQAIGRRLSGATLQRVFAIAILLVALFVLIRNFSS